MKALTRRAIFCLLLTLCALGGGIARAQSVPAKPEEPEIAALRSTMEQATTEFEGPLQGQSIVRFEEVVSKLESMRRGAALSEPAMTLLIRAYEYRARAYFNLGSIDKASDSLRALIVAKPSHALDAGQLSPKIVDLFKEIKGRMVGYITVQSIPQGASVSLAQEFLSVTDFFPIEVLAGDYSVEVTKRGYRSESKPVTIVAGETASLQFDLVRTAATALIVTEPVGVEVFLNGAAKGVTAGALDPAYAAMAAARGLDPAKASARLELSDLAAGSYKLEFRKPCYEPLHMTLDIPEPQDYDIAPVKLDPSVGSIAIASEPSGGQIFLDAKAAGQAPKTLDNVCSGEHRVEVRHPFGRFVRDVQLRRGEKINIAAVARPTIGFLGALATGPGGERVRDALAVKAQDLLLKSVTSLNVIRIDPETVRRVLESERTTLASLLPPEHADPALIRRVFERLGTETEVQGFLAIRVPEEQLIRRADAYVFAVGSVIPNVFPVVAEDEASFRPLLSALDRRAASKELVSGLVTIDTETHEGPVILRTLPGSPAEKAGFSPGLVIKSIGGVAVPTTAAMERAIASAGAKKTISVTVSGTAEPTTVDLVLEEAERELRPEAEGLVANKTMMDLRQTIEGYPNTEAAAYARLQLGLLSLRLGDFAAAHDAFVRSRNELPEGRHGLNKGTASFYAGVALEALGYAKEALEEYQKAALDESGTLGSRSGPLVKHVAGRRVAALASGR